MTKFKWTKDTEAEAARLWGFGKSGLEIAEILGGGLSRNAVMGKLHRMGVLKEKPHRESNIGKPGNKALPPYISKNSVANKAYGKRKHLGDLGCNECVFPVGERGKNGYVFCAAKTKDHVYCDRHKAICYQSKGKGK